MNKKIVSALGIGILLSPLFPTGGINGLITKLLERALFNTDLQPLISAGIASAIGLISSIIIFKKVIDYFSKLDYNDSTKLFYVFRISLIIFLGIQLIWSLIPFIDGMLGQSYFLGMNKGFSSINENVNYHIFIKGPAWIMGMIAGVIIIYKGVKKAVILG